MGASIVRSATIDGVTVDLEFNPARVRRNAANAAEGRYTLRETRDGECHVLLRTTNMAEAHMAYDDTLDELEGAR